MNADVVRTTFIMPYTQFMRPDGRQVAQYFDAVPIELEPYFKNILAQDNLRLEAEVLITGQVHFSITHEEWGDYDSILKPNGPEVPIAIDQLLRRFNVTEYQEWLKEYELNG